MPVSPGKPTRSKPRPKSKNPTRQAKSSTAMAIDDIAIESDGNGGDMRSSDLSDVPDDAPSSGMDSFIVPDTVGNDSMSDDQPRQGDVTSADSSNPAPLEVSIDSPEADATAAPDADPEADDEATNAEDVSSAASKRRRRTRRKAAPVNDSDEEDLTAMAKDDSNFSKGSGVKPSLLPPPPTTRSATAKPSKARSDATLSSDSGDGAPPSKRTKFDTSEKKPIDDMDNSLQAFMKEQQLAITRAVLDSVLPVLQSAIAAGNKNEPPLAQPIAQDAVPVSSGPKQQTAPTKESPVVTFVPPTIADASDGSGPIKGAEATIREGAPQALSSLDSLDSPVAARSAPQPVPAQTPAVPATPPRAAPSKGNIPQGGVRSMAVVQYR
ncbi:hypothetical protein DFH06DRAFT_1313305 [Mycena polygramma]|nr:hypothetical protein DFH06DRAFT_1313305 [Mycena polygramma]